MKSEEKRREIVNAADQLFVEQGYDRTSMNAISERVGGSKATLYGYFTSKEELLRAVLADPVAEDAERLRHNFAEATDLRAGLVNWGKEYLIKRLAPLPISNLRTIASLPQESGFGADFYAEVLRPAWQQFSQQLAGLMAEGRLREADPWVAAMHWKGLNEGELFEKRLLGAMTALDSVEIGDVAARAADAFLRIYGPDAADADTAATEAAAG
jgi:AcrR family transcriptional regulator